jgi:hypothetical protein
MSFSRWCFLFCFLGASWARSENLYTTDFENFPVGDDTIVGTDGWLGTSAGRRCHGIDEGIAAGLGKTAFLGFNPPAINTASVAIYRPVATDPVAEGKKIIEFYTVVGFSQSVAPKIGIADDFFFMFYNQANQQLAGVDFDLSSRTIYRYDGLASIPSSVTFDFDEYYTLTVRVNMETNRWSAELLGVPIFTDAVFTSTTRALNYRMVAAEWRPTNPFIPGNNWMLLANWTIDASANPVGFATAQASAGNLELTWPAELGYQYQLQSSTDLVTWPNLGAVRIPAASDPLRFTVPVSGTPRSYFRMQRTKP